jgi:peptidoglycan hydrolase CwlO-like protein
MQRESRYIGEQQKLQNDLTQVQQQLQTRERQVKKLQEKLDSKDQKISDLEVSIGNLNGDLS